MKSELATLITSGLQKLVAEDVLPVMPDVAATNRPPKRVLRMATSPAISPWY
jgi:hypothetical protein